MASSIGDARTRRVGEVAGLIAATVALAWVDAAAQTPPTPPPGRAERLAHAEFLMHKELPAAGVRLRHQCLSGQAPQATQRMRAEGWEQTLDASDQCPVMLARIGKDGGLLAAYEQLVTELGGDPAVAAALPAAIGAAARAGTGVAAIGNQRGAKITSSLALDAGFTVAYQQRVKHAAGMPDLSTLKPIVERCLAQEEGNLALCYSTGYVYGSRAVSQLPVLQ